MINNKENNFDIIVIGSGPAGLTASMYLARAGYKVLNITGEEPGGNLANIKILENYPGIVSCSGYDLFKIMKKQCKDVGVEFYEYEDVAFIKNESSKYEVYFDDERFLIGKTIILAIGGSHKTLGLKNEDELFGDGISFCATCDGPMYENKSVIVIGGGNSAFDFILTLSKYCKDVTLIHRRNEFRASKDMIDKVKKLNNVKFILDSNVTSIEKNHIKKMLDVTVNTNNNQKIISTDGVFYAIGFNPNTIRIEGENKNGIFYCGDVNKENYMQVITAAGDGCKAALDCIKYLQDSVNYK